MAEPKRIPPGVRVVSTGRFLPEKVLTNADLEALMDTKDEWIVQRTGIRQRHVLREGEGSTRMMAARAAADALRKGRLSLADVDMVLLATVTPEMTCPSTACRVLDDLKDEFGPTKAGALDLSAACSGFVYGLNIAHDLIRAGSYRTALVIGAEHLSNTVEYSTEGRATAILFGDAAGAAIIRATDEPGKGILAQRMHADGERWVDLYIPAEEPRDFPGGERTDRLPVPVMRMNGRAVFRFAVTTFGDVIQQTLEDAGLSADEVDHFVCHQSNVRILEAAKERFGVPAEKLAVNIDRVGNTSAASVPLLLDELLEAGRIGEGQRVMFVAFGGGLTWTTSLWQM